MDPADIEWCNNVLVAGSHPVKYHTWGVVEDLLKRGVQGDFAEAGVLAGGHPAVMGRVLDRANDQRAVHLFDSFQGIPQGTAEDNSHVQQVHGLRRPGEPMKSSGVSCASMSGVQGFLRSWGVASDRFKFYPGWFQDTMKPGTNFTSKLALLRVDVDLYESVKYVLEYLYHHVVPGGIVIFDDYGEDFYCDDYPCRQALLQYIRSRGLTRPEAVPVEGNPGTVWWRVL